MNIVPALVGAAPGVVVAAIASANKKKHDLAARAIMKTNLVPAKDTIKHYAPDTYVATSKEDVESSPLENWQKILINKFHSRVFSGGSPFYVNTKNPIIISPRLVNKELIGHEIGHKIDITKNKRTILDEFVPSISERRAWQQSPFAGPESDKVMKPMIASYKAGQIGSMGIAAAMIGALAAPLVMKALKK